MTKQDIEKLAIELRDAAFPGADAWAFAAPDTRERWIRAARLAGSRIERAVDKTLRTATANAHEIKQHEAAKMLREMRR